jgi:hypothetical protein
MELLNQAPRWAEKVVGIALFPVAILSMLFAFLCFFGAIGAPYGVGLVFTYFGLATLTGSWGAFIAGRWLFAGSAPEGQLLIPPWLLLVVAFVGGLGSVFIDAPVPFHVGALLVHIPVSVACVELVRRNKNSRRVPRRSGPWWRMFAWFFVGVSVLAELMSLFDDSPFVVEDVFLTTGEIPLLVGLAAYAYGLPIGRRVFWRVYFAVFVAMPFAFVVAETATVILQEGLTYVSALFVGALIFVGAPVLVAHYRYAFGKPSLWDLLETSETGKTATSA